MHTSQASKLLWSHFLEQVKWGWKKCSHRSVCMGIMVKFGTIEKNHIYLLQVSFAFKAYFWLSCIDLLHVSVFLLLLLSLFDINCTTDILSSHHHLVHWYTHSSNITSISSIASMDLNHQMLLYSSLSISISSYQALIKNKHCVFETRSHYIV